jgi:hypothetical protein
LLQVFPKAALTGLQPELAQGFNALPGAAVRTFRPGAVTAHAFELGLLRGVPFEHIGLLLI